MLKRKWAMLVLALCLVLFSLAAATAQSTTVPVSGPYPGGHVGLLGGASFQPGWGYVSYLRTQIDHDVIGDDGQTLASDNDTLYANINYIAYTTKNKYGGGRIATVGLVTFNQSVMRPYDDQSRNASGWGIGGTGLLGMWMKQMKAFDFQAGLAVFFPTGSFDSGGDTANHGYGFTTVMPTVGGVWYPKGNRESWNVSGVLRVEFCGTQQETDIKVGDVLDIDWGAGKYFKVGKHKKHLINVGISGFLEQQFTEQGGPLPSDSLPKYHVYGLGGEIHWLLPKRHLGVLLRVQNEFGAENASESTNVWMNVSYAF